MEKYHYSDPYAGMKFMPTGEISTENVTEYLKSANVVACGGSWMVPEKLPDAGEFDQIELLTREAATLLETLK